MKLLTTLLLAIISLTLFGQADSTQQVMIDLLDDMRKRPFFYELSYNPIRTKLAHNDTLAKVAMSQAKGMARQENVSHHPNGFGMIYILYKEGMIDSIDEGHRTLTECCANFVDNTDVRDALKFLNHAGYPAHTVTAHQTILMDKTSSEVGMGYAVSESNFVYICVILKN